MQLRRAGAVDVKRFGAAGDGISNDTRAFAAALQGSAVIFVPAGIYLIDRLAIPSGRTILTQGFATVFRQRGGLPIDVRPFSIAGSDVHIGDFTVEGNIARDPGEWHHGISIEAGVDSGSLSNIALGDVRGRNLRGDVVCIGAYNGRSIRDVRVGHVHGDNIWRNVVSIVGGRQLSVEKVTGTRVGLTHLDIEPEDYSGPVVGCTIGSVHGGFVQVAGTTAKSFIDSTRIGLLDLASPAQRSRPIDPRWRDRADGLTIRNVRSLQIDRFIARGFAGHALRQIWDPGALDDQRVHIAAAELSDCARDPRFADSYILGSRRATRLRIDSLAIDTPRPGVDVVRNCKEARIGSVRGKLPRGSRLIAQSGPDLEDLLYLLGGGTLALGGYRLARHFGG
jgi:hypothetical protein